MKNKIIYIFFCIILSPILSFAQSINRDFDPEKWYQFTKEGSFKVPIISSSIASPSGNDVWERLRILSKATSDLNFEHGDNHPNQQIPKSRIFRFQTEAGEFVELDTNIKTRSQYDKVNKKIHDFLRKYRYEKLFLVPHPEMAATKHVQIMFNFFLTKVGREEMGWNSRSANQLWRIYIAEAQDKFKEHIAGINKTKAKHLAKKAAKRTAGIVKKAATSSLKAITAIATAGLIVTTISPAEAALQANHTIKATGDSSESVRQTIEDLETLPTTKNTAK